LAVSLINLGVAYDCLASTDQALGTFQQARAVLHSLVARNPGVTGYRDDLARRLFNIARILSGKHRPAEALSASDQATQPWTELRRHEPGNIKYPGSLAAALGVSGHSRLDLGQVTEGRSDLKEAVRLFAGLRFPAAYDYYSLACFYSLLNETTVGPRTKTTTAEDLTDADRAVAAFRNAAAVSFADRAMAESDRDLNSIRSRLDFQALFLDMAFPVDPFAH
jgi:tetratricopeptide (TPR) repeat protein